MFLTKARKLFKICRSAALRRGLRYRVAAAVEHQGFLTRRQFKTIIDAGANKGQFTLACRAWQPGARILAFEPLSEEADTFERVFNGDRAVSLRRLALGSSAGDTEIHISGRKDSSSLLPISDLQERMFPGTGESGTRSIPVRRLADVLPAERLQAPALLKIDVQGFELELLKGATELLDHISAIYVECSFVELYEGQALAHEVISFLANCGFVLDGIYNPSYDETGRAFQADLAFERRTGS